MSGNNPALSGASNAVGNVVGANGTDTLVDFSVGSMPVNYGYDESFTTKEDDDAANNSAVPDNQVKPRILIMGLRK